MAMSSSLVEWGRLAQPPNSTLVEDYHRAMAQKKECWSEALKSMAFTTPFVLIFGVLFYREWPWVGILVFVIGSIVVLFLGLGADMQYYPRAPWQHPLYDQDLSGLRPANVLFSRWHCVDEPESDKLEVLIRRNGQLVEISVFAPRTETGNEQIVAKLISAMRVKEIILI